MFLDVLQELDDKVHSLHDQRMKHLGLERECSRLRQDLDRLALLQPLLDGQHSSLMECISFWCTWLCMPKRCGMCKDEYTKMLLLSVVLLLSSMLDDALL